MGFLGALLRLLGLRPREAPLSEPGPLALFSTLLGENYSFLLGCRAALASRESGFEAWAAAFAAEARLSVLKVHCGDARPAAWLLFGAAVAAELREAYLRSRVGGSARPEEAALPMIELAAVDILAENLGTAFAAEGAMLGYDIAEPGALRFYEWTLRDCRFLEFGLEKGSCFLAIDPEAYELLASRLATPGFREDVLGRSRKALADGASGGASAGPEIGRIRNEELKIEGGRAFPLGSLLIPPRLDLGFGAAKIAPRALLICADSALLADHAESGYRVNLRFCEAGSPGRGVEIPLWFLASDLGPYEVASEEWRALLRAAAARCAASSSRLLKLEAAASGAAPARAADAAARGPFAAISYNLSLGGAKGRLVLAFGPDFPALIAARIFGPEEVERLRLSSRNLFLALEAVNARIASASIASYRASLASAPASASSLASRLPIGGRPLYSILEELRPRDVAALLSKLAQKGFMRREERYAIFLHSSPGASSGGVFAAATPCEDYEALVARFPKRWAEADGERPRLYPAYESLDQLLEAHYEAAWLLYRELLADRLALSATGEAVLRASGEAFEARLREALAEQGAGIEALVRALSPEARNSLPWADRACELAGLSGLLPLLERSIGSRAAEALRGAIAAADERLARGREDAFELWKARRAFAAELREKQA